MLDDPQKSDSTFAACLETYIYEPDDSCDNRRVDAASDSEEVDMEHGESDVNDIPNVRSKIASETAMPAQSQSDSRVLRRRIRFA